MLPLLACLLATQVPVDEPPRLRTFLPNGSTIIVERVPQAKSLSVQLFVSARSTPETPKTNGMRHLLEHLLALGTKGDLDRRLETAGGYLGAETMRDATRFYVNLPAGKLSLGLAAIEETMHMAPVPQPRIDQEVRVIGEESALRGSDERIAAQAWQAAYGEGGLDAFGNLDVIRTATPALLSELHRKMYVGTNLVISIAGNIDLDDATKQASALLSAIPRGDEPKDAPRSAGSGATIDNQEGQARAAVVPSFRSPRAAWTLAAGLAVAASVPHCFVTYTPTTRNGLIIVGQTNGENIAKAFDEAAAEDLMNHGRLLARAWVLSQLRDPAEIAAFRGLLLVQSPALKPETLLENLDAMRLDQFREGLAAFQSQSTAQGGKTQ